MFSTTLIVSFLLFVITTINAFKKCADPRKEELARMKEYELIHFNLDRWESDNIIEFDAFKEHYIIALTPDHDRTPINIKHTKGNPTTDHSKRYYTSLTTTCHYTGSVTNIDTINTNYDRNFAALSLCDKRGVRGVIHAFNETLVIKPSQYYLDLEYDSNNYYSLSDEHLVFLRSGWDTTGLPMPHSMQVNQAGHKSSPPQSLSAKKHSTINKRHSYKSGSLQGVPEGNKRRRMAYNNGKSKLEMYILSDPSRTKYYMDTYGDNWYEQMVSSFEDFMSAVSSEYSSTNWGDSDIATVTVHLVELEIAFDYNGDYASLRPNFLDNAQSVVDGSAYLNVLLGWLNTYKSNNFGDFDNVQLWTDLSFGQSAGTGWVGTVCQAAYSSSNVAMCCGDDWAVRTSTHELGHNFDMSHDGQGDSVCHEDAGLMGYGSGTGFSECSKKSMRDYFRDENGLTCLGDGVRGFTSNYGGDTGGQTPAPTKSPVDAPTPNPVTAAPTKAPSNNPTRSPISGATPSPTKSPSPVPTPSPVSDGEEGACVGMNNFDISQGHIDFNGQWKGLDQLHNGQSCYQNGGYYLQWHSGYRVWWITTELGASGGYAHCGETELLDCSGNWNYYDGSSGWVPDTDVSMYDCSNVDTDTDTADTDTDTVPVDPGCDYLTCLTVFGLGYDHVNGDYEPAGCRNEKAMYFKPNGDGSGLYFHWSHANGLWLIHNEIVDNAAAAYCPADNIVDCTNNMYYYDNGWTKDTEVWVYDCAGGAFGASDDCDNEYSDELCITNRMWGNSSVWSTYGALCEHDQSVFYYKHNNETTYYLWYNEVTRYSGDNTTYGEWTITENEIGQKAGTKYAFCEQENLLKCTERKWRVRDESFGDMLQYLTDDQMHLHDGDECVTDLNEKNGNNDDGDEEMIAIAVVLSLVLVGVIVGIVYFVCKRRNAPKNFSFAANQGIQNNTVAIPENEEDLDHHNNNTTAMETEAVIMNNNNAEIEVEIEV